MKNSFDHVTGPQITSLPLLWRIRNPGLTVSPTVSNCAGSSLHIFVHSPQVSFDDFMIILALCLSLFTYFCPITLYLLLLAASSFWNVEGENEQMCK